MSVRIARLKIRMPAGAASRPEPFAEAVARHVAERSAGLGPVSADTLRLTVEQGRARDGRLAGRVGEAVTTALGNGKEG